jgi:hypothetical protein
MASVLKNTEVTDFYDALSACEAQVTLRTNLRKRGMRYFTSITMSLRPLLAGGGAIAMRLYSTLDSLPLKDVGKGLHRCPKVPFILPYSRKKGKI